MQKPSGGVKTRQQVRMMTEKPIPAYVHDPPQAWKVICDLKGECYGCRKRLEASNTQRISRLSEEMRALVPKGSANTIHDWLNIAEQEKPVK